MLDAVRVYFDTMVYLNKFKDPLKVKPETINIFNKVKSGKYHLVVSQTIFMEMYHVMCLPLEDIHNFDKAQVAMQEITNAYNAIKEIILHFPHTELVENEFNGINTLNLIDFVESVPGSALIDLFGKKLPGSMDFIQMMIASNLQCEKFFTFDEGIIPISTNQKRGNIEIIRPYRA